MLLLPLLLAADPTLSPDLRGASAPDRAFDMEALDLSLTIHHGAGAVEGVASWTARRIAPSLPGRASAELRLDQVGLTIRGVELEGRSLPHYTQGDSLFVSLPEGEGPFTVAVRYTATPRTGLHFRAPGPRSPDTYAEVWSQGEPEDNRHWFPSWDFPNDRFTYTGHITVADHPDWPVLTNTNTSLTNYLVMVAAGPYTVHGPPENQVWAPPGAAAVGIARAQDKVPAMMRHFAARTGVAYPWGPYRQVFVQRFLYTGMENTSATVMAGWQLDETVGTRGFNTEDVIAHELAHQWYGDLLTSRGWRELWLNEGFATFMASDWMRESVGPEWYARSARARIVGASRHTGAMAKRFHQGPSAPDNHNVYGKGATVLHQLRVMLGEDTFWAGIRRYTQDNAMRFVRSSDLQTAMEAASGMELDWFFQQWVELPYVPSLSVRQQKVEGGWEVTVQQKASDDRPRYTLPVDVEVGTRSGPLRARRWLDGERAVFFFPLDAPPDYVAVDPNGGLLAKIEQTQSVAAWEAQAVAAPPYARLVAIEALGEEEAPMLLRRIAGDSAAPLAYRLEAVEALGAQRDTSGLLPLVDDPNLYLRDAAYEALGKCFGVEVTQALLRRARQEEEPDLQGTLLASLARVAPDAARAQARRWLGGRVGAEEGRVRAAARVLGQVGEASDVRALLQVVGPRRAGVEARGAAVDWILRQPEGREKEALRQEAARRLELFLDDLDLRTRQATVGQLGRVGDARSVDALEALRRRETVEELRAAIRTAEEAIASRAPQAAPPSELEAKVRALEAQIEELQGEVDRMEERR